ncbi:MAG: hypothetical protein WKG07_23735 [Hymenobacter sp.]
MTSAAAQRPYPAPPDSLRELSRSAARRPGPGSDPLRYAGARGRVPGRRVRVGVHLVRGQHPHRRAHPARRAELPRRRHAGLGRPATARLEANRRRLFNLQLFHAVLVQASCAVASASSVLLFAVQERWYSFPCPILSLADRNLRVVARPPRPLAPH